MNILITGAAGFIGSNLTDELLRMGNKVIAIDNFDTFYDPEIKKNNLKLALCSDNFELITGDIRDKDLLNRCFENYKIDLVIHLAAKAGVRQSINDPAIYYDVNLSGTLNLLQVMNSFNCKKMLFASSSSVYGNTNRVPFSEDENVYMPISPYASSKKSCELICYNFHHLYNFDIFCLRLFTVFGPRQRPEMAIYYFVNNVYYEKTIQIFGDGNMKRDFTYIDDIVAGFFSSINKLSGYEIINLGESNTISVNSLITSIETILKKKSFRKYLPKQPGDVEITFADINKAKKLIGYNPKTNIQDGLKKFITWYLKEREIIA